MEHVVKNGKPILYLVFEYLDSDLKKYIDEHGNDQKGIPIPHADVKVCVSWIISLMMCLIIYIIF